MRKEILLCTDGSVHSVVAAEYAFWLARRIEGIVRAVHVTDLRLLEMPLLADLSGSIGAQPYQALLPQLKELHAEKARVILESVAEAARKRGVECVTHHRTGRLVETILEQERHADLVVMGERGEHAEHSGDMLGSNVERLVRRSAKPCLVTPGKFDAITRVLAAFDGSDHARHALDRAVELCRALSLRLTILTVADKNNQEGKALLDGAARLACSSGLTPDTKLLEGHADTEIVRFSEAEKIDLIVMGAYGHNRIREFVLGSTTSQVVRKAKVPVMLVRQPQGL